MTDTTKAKQDSDSIREDVTRNVHDLVNEAEELFVGGIDSLPTASEIEQHLSVLGDALGELYSVAEEKVTESARAADKVIRKHPYETAAIALGVGLLVGILTRRK